MFLEAAQLRGGLGFVVDGEDDPALQHGERDGHQMGHAFPRHGGQAGDPGRGEPVSGFVGVKAHPAMVPDGGAHAGGCVGDSDSGQVMGAERWAFQPPHDVPPPRERALRSSRYLNKYNCVLYK
ncbi:hypothetical protein JCM9957A_22230 [Kineosporia succinea]